jgi:hypothetical protein
MLHSYDSWLEQSMTNQVKSSQSLLSANDPYCQDSVYLLLHITNLLCIEGMSERYEILNVGKVVGGTVGEVFLDRSYYYARADCSSRTTASCSP